MKLGTGGATEAGAESSTLDVPPDDMRWGHGFGPGVDGVGLHYVLHGRGTAPVLLLHGWPGFWYDWRHVIPRLANDARLIAPDFRGFGDSDTPDLPPQDGYSPEILAQDTLALLDDLNVHQFVVAGHDVGAIVAQVLARSAPDRVRALALFNPPYPGIGQRRFDPALQSELWYRHFHALPWSDRLIGYELGTLEMYLGHFYEHWAGRKEAIRPVELEAIVRSYSRPGAVRSSLQHVRAIAAQGVGKTTENPTVEPITQPTVVLWGEADPVMPATWADRLGAYFPSSTLEILPGVGHFVPVEAPDETAVAIRKAIFHARVGSERTPSLDLESPHAGPQ
jgi:pimeloyl-ACP methyl ester carboxylesterase